VISIVLNLKTIADKADFRTSYNYSIDPTKTKLAQFSIDGLKGLLTKYDIIVE
jgi:hypothetical protein